MELEPAIFGRNDRAVNPDVKALSSNKYRIADGAGSLPKDLVELIYCTEKVT